MVVLILTITARLISVFIPIFIIFLVNKGKIAISWSQVFLISIGGIIRGAIAFGLSLQIKSSNSEILKTTT
jgi:hypothetical protein